MSVHIGNRNQRLNGENVIDYSSLSHHDSLVDILEIMVLGFTHFGNTYTGNPVALGKALVLIRLFVA